jgi:hypothetical protein
MIIVVPVTVLVLPLMDHFVDNRIAQIPNASPMMLVATNINGNFCTRASIKACAFSPVATSPSNPDNWLTKFGLKYFSIVFSPQSSYRS